MFAGNARLIVGNRSRNRCKKLPFPGDYLDVRQKRCEGKKAVGRKVIATEAISDNESTSRKTGEKWGSSPSQDGLYNDAAAEYGPALERLARAYEADPDHRGDLLQEIHIALWRSLGTFDQRCSLRTWVYRVAHNVGASHIARQYRARSQALLGLEEFENMPDPQSGVTAVDRALALNRLFELIHKLKPLDRDVILSYLEGLDAAAIGEITGLSARNVATKIHRTKNILARLFNQGGPL